MAGQWRVGISSTRREAVDIELLVQAVIALGRQLSREQQAPDEALAQADDADIAEEGIGQ